MKKEKAGEIKIEFLCKACEKRNLVFVKNEFPLYTHCEYCGRSICFKYPYEVVITNEK